MDNTISLKEYYKTKHWISLSKKLLDNKECECFLCKRKRWKLITRGVNKGTWKRELRFAVHHLSYDNLFHETEKDYMVLCSHCHSISHEIQRSKNVSPFYEELFKVVSKFGFIYKKEV
jgi:hypothetical protein